VRWQRSEDGRKRIRASSEDGDTSGTSNTHGTNAVERSGVFG
jgi:hypothetical protein